VRKISTLIYVTESATVPRMPRGRATQAETTDFEKQEVRTHSEMLRFRVTNEHAALIREAARRKGIGDVAAWIRETLVAAARKELAREGKGGRSPSSSSR
jgi:hypothetical protein